MSELSFFEDAVREVEEARSWYRERSEQAEIAFLRELDHAVETISESPERWPAYLAGTRRYVFPAFPFSVIFFVENDIVHVVAIAHQKRRPAYWRKRLRP